MVCEFVKTCRGGVITEEEFNEKCLSTEKHKECVNYIAYVKQYPESWYKEL